MLKPILTSVLALILSIQSIHLIGQKIKVDTKSIEEVDNKLVVKYDLIKSKEKQIFKVSLEIASSTGNPISIKSVSGDIGDSIRGGMNKQIIWDYNADGIILQEDISIEVIAWMIPSDVSMTKALVFSTLWPGLGLSKTQGNGPYWLMGLAGYGSLGASIYLNKQASENYQAYIDNTDDALNNDLLSKSQSQNQLSKTLAYSAIGIWSINLVWTAMKARHNNRNSTSMTNNKQFLFYSGIDPFTKTAGFTMKFKF